MRELMFSVSIILELETLNDQSLVVEFYFLQNIERILLTMVRGGELLHLKTIFVCLQYIFNA